MAKQNDNKPQKSNENQFENSLPQNMIALGEHVEENKNIYISQSTYKEIHRFTKDKTTNESGGVLLGKVIEEFGKTNIVIYAFVEAKHCESTPTTLKFTHETWEYIHKEVEKKYSELKILGWIHTHPDFGIFLSEYDTFIQQNFFSEENQIAYVIDPIQNIEGFYFWINGKIEKCKGFFVFDKNNTRITINDEKAVVEPVVQQGSSFGLKVFIGLLSILVLVLLLICINMNGKIKALNNQQKTLTDSANQALAVMQSQINSLQEQLNVLMNPNENIPAEESDVIDETTEPSTEPDESETSTEVDNTEPTEKETESNE